MNEIIGRKIKVVSGQYNGISGLIHSIKESKEDDGYNVIIRSKSGTLLTLSPEDIEFVNMEDEEKTEIEEEKTKIENDIDEEFKEDFLDKIMKKIMKGKGKYVAPIVVVIFMTILIINGFSKPAPKPIPKSPIDILNEENKGIYDSKNREYKIQMKANKIIKIQESIKKISIIKMTKLDSKIRENETKIYNLIK